MIQYPHQELTKQIISCVFTVHSKLGPGYLERVYENALVIELEKRGLQVARQCLLTVYYDGQVVGEYCADMMVEDKVLIELKATASLTSAHEQQIVNYLRATGLQLGLLVNFGSPRAQVKRKIV